MKQVLVIEDDPDLARLLTTILSLAGFKVDVAYTGDDGLMQLEHSMPDAIILDMHLPGVSGGAIYQMLEERQQASRVLICSADIQIVEEYRSRGVSAISKPIESITALTATIAKMADRSLAVPAS